jgi:tetratricopeptide (TPR) repeat protein
MRFRLPTLIAAGAAFAFSAAPAAAQEPSEDDVRMNYSLYYEAYKNDDFAFALPYLNWMLENAPFYPQNDDRNFDRAYRAYKAMAEAQEDGAMKRAYADSAMTVLSTMVSRMEDNEMEADRYETAIRRGNLYRDFYGDEGAQGQCEAYREAFELNPDETADYYINSALGCVLRESSQTGDADALITYYDNALAYLDDPEYAQNLVEPYLDPEVKFENLLAKYDAGEELSDEQLEELFRGAVAFDRPGLRNELAPRMAELRPTVGLLRQLGDIASDNGDTEEALSRYEQALELADATEDAEKQSEQKRDIYYSMATMANNEGQSASARNYAKRALQFDSRHAPSLYLIGSVYAAAAQYDSVEAKAPLWVAVDYFNRAANGEGPAAAAARQAASRYSAYFPSTEDIFFLDIQPGQRYTVGGWINETTTVRTK